MSSNRNTISAKQIAGVVQDSGAQIIRGDKTFSDRIISKNSNNELHIILKNGCIYWVSDPDHLDEEGNMRIRINNGAFSHEAFSDGWTAIGTK